MIRPGLPPRICRTTATPSIRSPTAPTTRPMPWGLSSTGCFPPCCMQPERPGKRRKHLSPGPKDAALSAAVCRPFLISPVPRHRTRPIRTAAASASCIAPCAGQQWRIERNRWPGVRYRRQRQPDLLPGIRRTRRTHRCLPTLPTLPALRGLARTPHPRIHGHGLSRNGPPGSCGQGKRLPSHGMDTLEPDGVIRPPAHPSGGSFSEMFINPAVKCTTSVMPDLIRYPVSVWILAFARMTTGCIFNDRVNNRTK